MATMTRRPNWRVILSGVTEINQLFPGWKKKRYLPRSHSLHGLWLLDSDARHSVGRGMSDR